MRGFHLGKDRRDHFEVGVRPHAGGAFGGQPLKVAAKGDVVLHSLVMAGEEFDQGRGKGVAQNLGHKGPCAGTGDKQPLRLQHLQCLTQRGARHAQTFGQIALCRKPLTRAQDAAQDQQFDLAGHGLR